jgi:carboxypeptidase C (cathepsin A)
MKKLSRLITVVLFSGAVCCICFGQQADTPKATNPKKSSPPTSQPPEKAAESTVKPEASAEPKPAPREPSGDREKDKERDKEEHYDMTEAAPVLAHHQITVDRKLLKYTAAAGRLPIKRGDGRIEAEMFYVAYTLDGQDAAKRPLTFAFNGGPGSASIWLHMGALGPRKVVLQPDGFMPPAP